MRGGWVLVYEILFLIQAKRFLFVTEKFEPLFVRAYFARLERVPAHVHEELATFHALGVLRCFLKLEDSFGIERLIGFFLLSLFGLGLRLNLWSRRFFLFLDGWGRGLCPGR